MKTLFWADVEGEDELMLASMADHPFGFIFRLWKNHITNTGQMTVLTYSDVRSHAYLASILEHIAAQLRDPDEAIIKHYTHRPPNPRPLEATRHALRTIQRAAKAFEAIYGPVAAGELNTLLQHIAYTEEAMLKRRKQRRRLLRLFSALFELVPDEHLPALARGMQHTIDKRLDGNPEEDLLPAAALFELVEEFLEHVGHDSDCPAPAKSCTCWQAGVRDWLADEKKES